MSFLEGIAEAHRRLLRNSSVKDRITLNCRTADRDGLPSRQRGKVLLRCSALGTRAFRATIGEWNASHSRLIIRSPSVRCRGYKRKAVPPLVPQVVATQRSEAKRAHRAGVRVALEFKILVSHPSLPRITHGKCMRSAEICEGTPVLVVGHGAAHAVLAKAGGAASGQAVADNDAGLNELPHDRVRRWPWRRSSCGMPRKFRERKLAALVPVSRGRYR